MVELKNVTKAYGNRMILADISHSFPCGKITTVIAPNGTGKTTLLGLISGLVLRDKGEVSVGQREKAVIVLAGEKNLYMKATVRENLTVHWQPHGIPNWLMHPARCWVPRREAGGRMSFWHRVSILSVTPCADVILNI